ncbi:MAG TPA: hypothetical protein VLV76_20730 [Candidatus Acidoferrum sp.]|nr:hypothetical protein [Candidatus Acidoferrum sp.]
MMMHPGFVVAMAAETAFGEFDAPSRIVRRATGWLIVSRWGPAGQYLSISSTQTAEPGTKAPVGLTPRCTSIGCLLSEDSDASEGTFLLVRQLPPDTVVAGSFFPTDGYARLSRCDGRFRLTAAGRYAHGLHDSWGPREGPDTRVQPCNNGAAFAWHIDAVQRQWDGEFVEPVRWRLAGEIAATPSPAPEAMEPSPCRRDAMPIVAEV